VDYKFPPHLVTWSLSLLEKRLQYVRIGSHVSDVRSGAARHKKSRRKKSNADKKSRRKKSNADKDIKLRAKVYVKHTVTMYDQHDCCNILQKKVDANASLASAWRRHWTFGNLMQVPRKELLQDQMTLKF
jgi:hypothetical protein